MNTTFQLAVLFALGLACIVPAGNYFINRRRGVCPVDNRRDTALWGLSFSVYAVLDYLVLQF